MNKDYFSLFIHCFHHKRRIAYRDYALVLVRVVRLWNELTRTHIYNSAREGTNVQNAARSSCAPSAPVVYMTLSHEPQAKERNKCFFFSSFSGIYV